MREGNGGSDPTQKVAQLRRRVREAESQAASARAAREAAERECRKVDARLADLGYGKTGISLETEIAEAEQDLEAEVQRVEEAIAEATVILDVR